MSGGENFSRKSTGSPNVGTEGIFKSSGEYAVLEI